MEEVMGVAVHIWKQGYSASETKKVRYDHDILFILLQMDSAEMERTM